MSISSTPRRLGALGRVALATEVAMTYARVRWLMRTHDLSETVSNLRSDERGVSALGDDAGFEVFRLVEASGRVLRLFPTDTRCLARSLVTLRVLARRGVHTRLIIGVRTVPEFGAHAWIELAGRALLEPGDTAQGRLLEL
jgi:hypothetical protein